MNTMVMPTGSVLVPPAIVGVSNPVDEVRVKRNFDSACLPMSGTINMHIAIPIAPPMKRNFLPKRSTVQVALSVKIIPQVALRALIRLIVSVDLNTFL